MIVDCHVHIWETPADVGLELTDAGQTVRPLAADVSDHMEAAQAVDFSIAWGFASRRMGREVSTSFLGQHIGLLGSRMVGLAGIDPSDPAWRDKLLEAVDEWAFRGVTLCPAAQDLHPLDNRALAVYELCSERGLPVAFDLPSQWLPGATLHFARPALVDNVAREFPDLRILVSGFAYPYVAECLVLLEKWPTVLTDTGHLASRPLAMADALARAYEAGVLDKVLLGSGFPFAWPRKVLATIFRQCGTQGVSPEFRLPREAVESLVHRDALAALGIEKPETFAATLAAAQQEEGDASDDDTDEDDQ